MSQILHLLCTNNYFGMDKECWLPLKGVQSLAIQFASPAHLRHKRSYVTIQLCFSLFNYVQDLLRSTEVCSWFALNTL